MNTINELRQLVLLGKITRREFIAWVSAFGAAAALSSFLSTRSANASVPQKGGRFTIGMAGGATTDSLEPGKLLDHMPMVVQWQIKNNLIEIDPEGNAVPELAESWINARWDNYEGIIAFDRNWLAQLPDEVARQIVFENAKRLFDQ